MSDQITQSYRKVFSSSKGFLTNSVFYHENQDYTKSYMENCGNWKKVGICFLTPPCYSEACPKSYHFWYTLESFHYVKNIFRNI